MEWENKTIGFAMCGSFCTANLIQLHGLIVKKFCRVHNLILWVQMVFFTQKAEAFSPLLYRLFNLFKYQNQILTLYFIITLP